MRRATPTSGFGSLAWLTLAAAIAGTVTIGAVSYYVAATAKENLERRRRGMGLAGTVLSFYDTLFGHLPTSVFKDDAGKVLGSWRFEMMMFEDWGAGHGLDSTAPWNSPKNKWLANQSNSIFCRESKDSDERLNTTIVAITGPDTAFDGKHVYKLAELPPQLIIIVELAHSHIHWMAPGDLDINDIHQSITDGLDGNGVYVGFVDGNCWLLRRDVPISDLKKFMTIEEAKKYDREKVLGSYVISRN